MSWYAKESGDQGLIIDDEDGRTVAVCYDKKDMHVIAASRKLLEACEKFKEHIYSLPDDTSKCRTLRLAFNSRSGESMLQCIEEAKGDR